MLICKPKETIIILRTTFEFVKQFFLSGTNVFYFMSDPFFSNLLLQLQLYLAISVLP